jgi:hypothetical protein
MVDKQQIIQFWHVEKKSEVEIASVLGVSRNTVRRYVKSFNRALEQSQTSGLPEPILSDFLLTVPKYNAKNRGKRKLTTEIMDSIDGYLDENKEKCRTGKRKQILKSIDIWELLQGSGHDIGYTVVCDYILIKKSGNQEAFIRQEYNPGENCEFDWCDIKLTISGVERKLYLAVFTICKSNYRFTSDNTNMCFAHLIANLAQSIWFVCSHKMSISPPKCASSTILIFVLFTLKCFKELIQMHQYKQIQLLSIEYVL